MVWSDDGGTTWSDAGQRQRAARQHAELAADDPPNGTIVDAYLDYGPDGSAEGPEAAAARAGAARAGPPPPEVSPQPGATPHTPSWPPHVHRRRRDVAPGGRSPATWATDPTASAAAFPPLPPTPCTGTLYAAWNSVDAARVKLSRSTDGTTWSSPVVVNRPTRICSGSTSMCPRMPGRVRVVRPDQRGHQQRPVRAPVRGHLPGRRDSFLAPTAVGPQINYAYAAVAGGIFPGDYIGSAMTQRPPVRRWAVSSTPPRPGARYHQVLYGASFDTTCGPLPAAAIDEESEVLRP